MSLPAIRGSVPIKKRIFETNEDDIVDQMTNLQINQQNNNTLKISQEQKKKINLLNDYDDDEFHPMYYDDESSMNGILRIFSKRGLYLNELQISELMGILNSIDRKLFPMKWNFIMQLISCKISPKDCFVESEIIPAKRTRFGGKQNKTKHLFIKNKRRKTGKKQRKSRKKST